MKTYFNLLTKALIASICFCMVITYANAQNIAISDDDGYTADGSAMLDVKSTTKGFLAPRLSTDQRDAIVSPATGLLIFDTDQNSFYFYNGAVWINLTSGNPSYLWGLSGSNVYLNNLSYKLGVGTTSSAAKLGVQGTIPINSNEPLFEVINSAGDTVFAVYSQGVRVRVADDALKAAGSRSGFAVGGFSMSKANTNEYLRVTPDSVRIYIQPGGIKASGSRSGFAVGGFSVSKGTVEDFIYIAEDSSRVYTNGKGGFAAKDISTPVSTSYMNLTPENYFIGHESGIKNTTGIYNSFLGYQAGKNNVQAQSNVFIGYQSGTSTTGEGAYWWQGGLNVFVGYKAGFSNLTGGQNLAIGPESFYSNINGDFNIAVGYQSLYTNSSGTYNLAVGKLALYANTTGSENMALGSYALNYNTEGWSNVAVGGGSLSSNTIGNYNCGVGISALPSISDGSYNIGIGKFALMNNQHGNYNTAIGTDAANLPFYNDFSNTATIGYNAMVYADNSARIGNTSMVSIGGQVDWSVLSDGRFKENVHENVPGLAFIRKLRPVTYNLNIQKLEEFKGITSCSDWSGKYDIEKMNFTGFIAQEVEQIAIELGYDFSGIDKTALKNGGTYALRYAEFTVPLVKAIQEQQEMIEALQKQVSDLENTVR
ncbi:MAG: tail fiber domain-containing protein [Bacteroidia bacterium]|nr:tail fiber domain-containing protein [Bacteroidia bacterium]